MTPRKVLFLTTHAITLRAFLVPAALHFRQRGWRVEGMAKGISECRRCREAFDRVWEVDWSRNPLDIRTWRSSMETVRVRVQEGGYDIVHVHTPVAAFLTRFALRRRAGGRPAVIYTAHGFHFHPRGGRLANTAYSALEKLAGRWTDYLVVINQVDFEAARRHRVVRKDRLKLIPGVGIDLDFFDSSRVSSDDVAAVRKALGISEESKVLLMIAEFNPGKRHIDALRAFARLNRPDAHLVLAGTGRMENSVRQAAVESGIGDRVHFPGFCNDIRAWIACATATVLTSEREGLSRSVMESLSMETPVIGSDIRGVRDLLEAGGGILVPVGHPESLVRAMQFLLDNPDACQRMGRAGRKSVERYSVKKILVQHEQLYGEALSSFSRS